MTGEMERGKAPLWITGACFALALVLSAGLILALGVRVTQRQP